MTGMTSREFAIFSRFLILPPGNLPYFPIRNFLIKYPPTLSANLAFIKTYRAPYIRFAQVNQLQAFWIPLIVDSKSLSTAKPPKLYFHFLIHSVSPAISYNILLLHVKNILDKLFNLCKERIEQWLHPPGGFILLQLQVVT